MPLPCADCNMPIGSVDCHTCYFGKQIMEEGATLIKPRRLSRDEYFMQIARTVAKRGTCPRAEVGAVVVGSNNRILGAGYNGSPPGHPHCLDVGCKLVMVEGKQYCIRTIHAEVNAVLTVVESSDKLTLYCTHHPCFECIKVIAAKGITSVIYSAEYIDPKWEMIKDEYPQITFRRVQS
jgi:dCMP deaminase